MARKLKKTATSDNRDSPKPDELIDELAALELVAYERRREAGANHLGIRVAVLDKLVWAARAVIRKQSSDLPYWKVEPASRAVDGDLLLQATERRLRRHIVADDAIFTAAALWDLFAWNHSSFVHSPILLTTSKEPNSGKTTLIELLKFMVPRGMSTTEISAAALYRSIEKWRPTLLVDEADSIFKQNHQLRAVFNSGWTRGSGVVRCNPETLEPENFLTFGPKVVGMKGRQIPDTMLGRSIVLEMKRKRRSEAVGDFLYDDDAELAELRSQAARWAADNGKQLADMRPAVPDGFHNRLACNWRPLFAIADLAGGDWPAKARASARALSKEEPTSRYVEALAAIRAMFDERAMDKAITEEVAGRMFSQDIVAALVAIEDGPWKFYGGKDRDKPITQNGLARLLKPIAPQNLRIGAMQAKGYERHQFEEDFERYLGDGSAPETPSPPPTPPFKPSQRPKCGEIRGSGGFKPSQGNSVGTDEKCEKPNNHGLGDGGTVGKGGWGPGAHVATAPGLPEREIQDLAHWYVDRAAERVHEDGGIELNRKKLDADLREALRERCLPEHVETEFTRVMAAVFRV
jgi:putative DNA primase/helicase